MSWENILERVYHFFYGMTLFRIGEVSITLNHLFVAAMAVAISLLLSSWARRFLQKRVLQPLKLEPGLEFTLLRVVHYLILFTGIYIGLATLSIPMGALIGFFTLLGVGIGFGLQNMASNFISGIILLVERPISIGDRITVDDVWGDVQQINLRTTLVNTPDNVSIIIPNSKLLENNLINWTYGDRRIRLRLPVGVAYGSDIDLVTRLIIQAAAEQPYCLTQPAPEAWFTGFGDSALDFEIVFWITDSKLKPNAVDAVNRGVDKQFPSTRWRSRSPNAIFICAVRKRLCRSSANPARGHRR